MVKKPWYVKKPLGPLSYVKKVAVFLRRPSKLRPLLMVGEIGAVRQ
jgi:hypothetical protein